MRKLKSIIFEDNLDTEVLIDNEEEFSDAEGDSQNDRASNYSDYQETGELSYIESDQSIAKTESLNSMPESNRGSEDAEAKDLQLFMNEKYEDLTSLEKFLPDKNTPLMKSWRLLLRCSRISRIKRPHDDKIWRPVLVKLEENTLKFYAEDFESSPPFKTVNLTWFFSIPGIKTKLIQSEFLFTAVLMNALHGTRGRLAKTFSWSSRVKLGCTNYTVLLDFIETVEKCVATFPAFRPVGIFYEREKTLLHVKDLYEVVQEKKAEVAEQEKCNVVAQVVQQEKHNVVLKRVQIMLKAKVSASPECSVHVKHSERFSNKPAVDDVSFHKCVKSRSVNNQTITARVLPLDNCWFQLMSWNGCCSTPVPLRCEITITGNTSVQIQARIFTSSTHLEVKSARDITLRFYIPSQWLETKLGTIQKCTDVTKGSVSYSPTVETMLWSIPKLSFNPCRHFYRNGKPLATLNALFESASYCQEMVKVPVEMDFYTKGSPRSSEIEVTNVKLGLKSLGKFKARYTSMYRVRIPVT